MGEACSEPLALCFCFVAVTVAFAGSNDLTLWYSQPAQKWTEALPIGNGHMGAMVFGGVPEEHIQFNEHTVWTGQPRSYAHLGAVKVLPELRRLLEAAWPGRTFDPLTPDVVVEAARVAARGAHRGRTLAALAG